MCRISIPSSSMFINCNIIHFKEKLKKHAILKSFLPGALHYVADRGAETEAHKVCYRSCWRTWPEYRLYNKGADPEGIEWTYMLLSNVIRSRWSSYVRIFCTPFVCVDNLMTKLKMPSWRTFWRKIKWEKRRLFSSSPAVHVQYDPSSYSQNFDDGYSTDPDNLSRSFSARFAVPSKIFDKSEMVCNGDK
ncbi:hypothetical protein AAZX31_15G014200 [Glycine max]